MEFNIITADTEMMARTTEKNKKISWSQPDL